MLFQCENVEITFSSSIDFIWYTRTRMFASSSTTSTSPLPPLAHSSTSGTVWAVFDKTNNVGWGNEMRAKSTNHRSHRMSTDPRIYIFFFIKNRKHDTTRWWWWTPEEDTAPGPHKRSILCYRIEWGWGVGVLQNTVEDSSDEASPF